jgi:hypothetical protein
MALSESSYIVGENDLKEFRENVERQNSFLSNEITRFKPTQSIQDFGSLIATILLFLAILSINKEIFLNYWIQATLIFLIFARSMSFIGYFKIKKPNLSLFHDSKQLKIAYFLSLKANIINLKFNDSAFCIMWAAGFIILIYNFFENQLVIGFLLIALFGLIFLFSVILMFYSEVLYDFYLWINTKVTSPVASLELITDKNFQKAMNNFNWTELRHIKGKHALFMVGLIIRDLLIISTIIIIFSTFLQSMTWIIFRNIFLLSIFQILTFVTLVSFLSFKKIEEILENQKIMVIRAVTFLDKSKQSINRQQINSAKNYLKLSKLFLGQKRNFAIFFTWVEVIANGELNIEENYDLLYHELGIPQE